jgi:hypothetical protein
MSAAQELGPYGVTANMVYPPVTDTGWVTPAVEKAAIAASPLRRLASPTTSPRSSPSSPPTKPATSPGRSSTWPESHTHDLRPGHLSGIETANRIHPGVDQPASPAGTRRRSGGLRSGPGRGRL